MSAWDWCVACGMARVDAPELCHDGKHHRLARYTFRAVAAPVAAAAPEPADGGISWVEPGQNVVAEPAPLAPDEISLPPMSPVLASDPHSVSGTFRMPIESAVAGPMVEPMDPFDAQSFPIELAIDPIPMIIETVPFESVPGTMELPPMPPMMAPPIPGGPPPRIRGPDPVRALHAPTPVAPMVVQELLSGEQTVAEPIPAPAARAPAPPAPPAPPPPSPAAAAAPPRPGRAPDSRADDNAAHLKGPGGIPFDPAFLARYRPLGVLGKGGSGIVYRVIETNTGREAALKFLVQIEKPSLARFEAECQTLSRLNHPRVLKVLGQGTWRSFPFMLTEVVEGESLKDRLSAEGSLSIQSALETTLEILEGLTYLHAQGVVHRDLKPANIFLVDGGELRIGDFGVARSPWRQSALTEPGTVVGTPRYMAPEQATGEPITFATDLYSLGIVLFELLTGRPPFVAPSLAALLAAHVRKKPPTLSSIRPELPPELDGLVQKALEKKATRRYASADEFAGAIRTLLAAGIAEGTAAPVDPLEFPHSAPTIDLPDSGGKVPIDRMKELKQQQAGGLGITPAAPIPVMPPPAASGPGADEPAAPGVVPRGPNAPAPVDRPGLRAGEGSGRQQRRTRAGIEPIDPGGRSSLQQRPAPAGASQDRAVVQVQTGALDVIRPHLAWIVTGAIAFVLVLLFLVGVR